MSVGTPKLLRTVADGSEALHLVCWMPYVNTCRKRLVNISTRWGISAKEVRGACDNFHIMV
jgi:hypothetical protein